MKIVVLILTLIVTSCSAQNSVATNEIFLTSERKFGVKDAQGNVLIKPIYTSIRPLSKHARLRLPPRSAREPINNEAIDYYTVSNDAQEAAIFNANGKQLIDFCACGQFQIDEHTQTMVVVSDIKGTQQRSQVYTLQGKLLFEEFFEGIGYINDADLIALIKEDGSNDEFYLYNPFTKKRIGPYDHFNIYNKDFDPTMGIETIQFEKLVEPVGISVRLNSTWGFVDMKGNEIHPMKFGSFRYITADMRKTYIALSEKPENVEFMFYGRLLENRSQLVFFDKQLNEYYFRREDSGKTRLELKK